MNKTQRLKNLKIGIHSILRAKKLPLNLRFFFIDKTQYLRVYKGMIQRHWGVGNYYLVNSLKVGRGDILNIFSKIEFIINEIIHLKLLEPNSKQHFKLDELLEKTSLNSQIILLKKWNVINNNLKKKLEDVKGVRNGFAHSWDKHEVYYQKILITQNFKKFKSDLVVVWKELIKAHTKEQGKLDFIKILKQNKIPILKLRPRRKKK